MITDHTYIHPSVKEFKTLLRVVKLAWDEFEGETRLYGTLNENYSATLNELRKQGCLFRINLFSEYYNISQEEIEALIKVPQSQRIQACNEKGVNPYVLRTLFDYNRYPECYLLHNFLSRRFEVNNKNLLDFGCLVSDYGFYFGMLNMNITLCDLKEHADFAGFRLSRASISHVKVYAPVNYKEVTKDQDIAVFGEVLEHLDDPYLLLESCIENNVKYIFTTGYPYGDESYFNLPGHKKEAAEQAPQCIDLLKKNYQEFGLMKRITVWVNNEEFVSK